jgi:hypothetical protein
VSLAPRRWQRWAAAAVIAAGAGPWLARPEPAAWICWKESEVNSASRRQWTREAAAYMAARYRSGAGILLSFGDITGILRTARIPVRESLHEGDLTLFEASLARPDLFLWQEWVLCSPGDRVSRAMARLRPGPRRYECVRIYAARDSPGVEIWRRIGRQP